MKTQTLIDRLISSDILDFSQTIFPLATKDIKEIIPELEKRNEPEKVEIAKFFISRRALLKLEKRNDNSLNIFHAIPLFPPCFHLFSPVFVFISTTRWQNTVDTASVTNHRRTT